MPFKIDIYPDIKIIYAQAWGYLSLDDVVAADAKLLELLESIEQGPVFVISDVQNLTGVSAGLHTLLRKTKALRHPQLVYIISINPKPKPILTELLEKLVQVLQIRYHRVRTFDEAMQKLRQFAPETITSDIEARLHSDS